MNITAIPKQTGRLVISVTYVPVIKTGSCDVNMQEEEQVHIFSCSSWHMCSGSQLFVMLFITTAADKESLNKKQKKPSLY
jgi:hypothetical protein